jgi:plasmid stabilization system protein ParE
MKIRYAPQARADLDEIFAYLDERSPAAARSVKARDFLPLGVA